MTGVLSWLGVLVQKKRAQLVLRTDVRSSEVLGYALVVPLPLTIPSILPQDKGIGRWHHCSTSLPAHYKVRSRPFGLQF
jgi:hypothetical protein